jgi:hypothetical protein
MVCVSASKASWVKTAALPLKQEGHTHVQHGLEYPPVRPEAGPSSPGRPLPGGIMRALPGDRVLIKERRAGEGDREAVILEVWSEHGRPPYVVRWHDGSRKIFFPASADMLIAGGLSR